MNFPRLRGWKFRAWAGASAAWSVFYLFFADPVAVFPAEGVRHGLPVLVNWLFNGLFPIALLYLILTIGKRR